MSDPSYKQLKEDFVSNLAGGSVTEINYVTASAPVAVLLWSVLQAGAHFFTPYTVMGLAVDYLLNIVVFILAVTIYAGTPLLLCVLLLVPALLVGILGPGTSRARKTKVPPSSKSSRPLDLLPVKPFLTTYRGYMLVTTCVGILAVDFHLFPRRFAKVETWGTSLMDLGVGSFVFSAGVVAARPVLKERATGKAEPVLRRVVGSMRHSIPLLVLGVIRLLSVKGLDYAEHVTEYGVHWNFFFTLGFLPPFVAVFQAVLRYVPSYAALALFVAGTYQVVLETTELKAFILTAPRVDLISMNREGIFGFFGYLAIFLTGQDLGLFVIPRNINPRSRAGAGTQRNTLLMTIAVWTGIWSGLYFLTTDYRFGLGLDVSRRLANLPYVLWIAAFNSAQIFAFCAIDTIFFPKSYNAQTARAEKEACEFATSPALRAFNRNGLAIFLVANLLTGLVNMSVRTLEATPVMAMGILVAYTAVLTLFAVGLDVKGISIKL